MTGGFSTPKKDRMLKVSGGQTVKTGEILVRGLNNYKGGANTRGLNPILAACPGKVVFSRKKTPMGKLRTFVSVVPLPNK